MSTRFPHRAESRARRLARAAAATVRAAAATLALAVPAGAAATADGPVPSEVEGLPAAASAPSTYRVFLTDGTSVATVGEFTKIGDRVVVTIGLADKLAMTSLPASQVDWERTNRYTEAIRAAHYAATRGEADFAAMSAVVARTLSDVAVTPGAAAQLALAERARRQLVEWPRDHFNYRGDEVRQTIALLDEVIAGLRAAAGKTAFDVSLVANVLPPPPEPVLPPPTLQDAIEQALRLSALASPGAERSALAGEARAALAAAPPSAWQREAQARADRILTTERRLDRRYNALTTATLRATEQRFRANDVAGLLRVRARVVERDAALGQQRPDAIQALLAAVDERLDAARRLQLARDQWAGRAPVLRRYRRDIAPWIELLAEHRRTLDAIRALSGPSIERLRSFEAALDRLAPILRTVEVPAEARGAHAGVVGAIGLATAASRGRARAIESQSLPVAWDASAAAAGALLMIDRAARDLTALLTPPAHP